MKTGQGAATLGLVLGLVALGVPMMGATGVLIWLAGRRGRPRIRGKAAAHPPLLRDAPSGQRFLLRRGNAGLGHASGGAFDIAMGDVVTAWGFGPDAATPDRIRTAMTADRVPAHHALEVDRMRSLVRKSSPLALDLNGIAKGYGVDRLTETLVDLGIEAGLAGIDGEMRALGLRPDGQAWTIAVEAPDPDRRAPHSILALQDAAVATSGDYRHWVLVQGRRLSHTMDPHRGAPVLSSPASVTVVVRSCAEADAWATALMVKGSLEGAKLARRYNLDALFIDREGDHLRETRVGRLFEIHPDPERVV